MQGEQRKQLESENTFIEVWEVTSTTLRKNKPWTHTRVERICGFTIAGRKCGKLFTRKKGADGHAKSHNKINKVNQITFTGSYALFLTII